MTSRNIHRAVSRPLRESYRIPIIVSGALAAALVLYLLYAFYWPNSFSGVHEKQFFVSRGETFSSVVDSLSVQGVIRDRGLFAMVANLHSGPPRAQVGKYVFKSGASNAEIFADLRGGRGTVVILVTLREGLTLKRQARVLGRYLGIDSAKFLRLVSDPEYVRGLGVPSETLEGFLLPDTYGFSWQQDEHEVIRKIVEGFKKFYTDTLKGRADEMGFSTRQILAMASIVEGETRLDEERPVIAGVYYNRLRLGMRLEADPTIQYALGDGPRRLLYADLSLESPYNTYKHAGLPPGPVNNPGRASIIAALYPAQHRYIFFVANGRGGHWFSRTYDEHLRNVRRARKLRALAESAFARH